MTDSNPINSLALGGFPITAVRLESRLEVKFCDVGTIELKNNGCFFCNKKNKHKNNLIILFFI